MTTKQEFFDKTMAHLASMPHRAMKFNPETNEQCAYLSDDGLKCAVGAHLPDGPWQQSFAMVNGILFEWPESVGTALGITAENRTEMVGFWIDLQKLHDTEPNWDSSGFVGWHWARNVADKHGVVFN